MAEGGAAVGKPVARGQLEAHSFRGTMRGGKMLSNWRMAQLHAQEAPERVLELEDLGAPTLQGRPDLQRDFGGHRYARLADVGDRTGLEMIRTLQQRAVQLGIDVFMHDHRPDGDRLDGAEGGGSALPARDRSVHYLRGAGRDPRDRRHRQELQGLRPPNPWGVHRP